MKILSKQLCSCSQQGAFLQGSWLSTSPPHSKEEHGGPSSPQGSSFLPDKAAALENGFPLFSQELASTLVLLSCLQDKDSGIIPSLQLQLSQHRSFRNWMLSVLLQVRHSASTRGALQVGDAMPREGVSLQYTAQHHGHTVLHRPQTTLARESPAFSACCPGSWGQKAMALGWGAPGDYVRHPFSLCSASVTSGSFICVRYWVAGRWSGLGAIPPALSAREICLRSKALCCCLGCWVFLVAFFFLVWGFIWLGGLFGLVSFLLISWNLKLFKKNKTPFFYFPLIFHWAHFFVWSSWPISLSTL